MLRSAQPSQFSTYPSQYIDTPVLAVLYTQIAIIKYLKLQRDLLTSHLEFFVWNFNESEKHEFLGQYN